MEELRPEIRAAFEREQAGLAPSAALRRNLVEAVAAQLHLFERRVVSGITAHLFERSSVFVRELFRCIRRQCPREQPAAETANSKACRFFRRKYKQLDRMLWTETAALQRANRFEATEHPNDAIILSGVGYGVDMRARAQRRSAWFGTHPASKDISYRVLAHGEARFFAAGGEPRTRFEIRWRKNDSGYRGRLCFGNRSEFLDPGCQATLIDF